MVKIANNYPKSSSIVSCYNVGRAKQSQATGWVPRNWESLKKNKKLVTYSPYVVEAPPSNDQDWRTYKDTSIARFNPNKAYKATPTTWKKKDK